MKCFICGGTTEDRAVTDLYVEGGIYIAIENVPAEVCMNCGEHYYTPDVTQRLLDLTKKVKSRALPGERAELSVFDFVGLRAS